MATAPATEFIYVGDVMCSWCWGFAPALTKLAENFQIPIRVVNGGLRPGPSAERLDDRMAGFLAHHWQKVAKTSGQPFDDSFLERRDDWNYDTELPAIAVATMREHAGDSTLEFFTRLQHAFYAEGVDVTDPGVYGQLLEGFAVDTGAFLSDMASTEMKRGAWEDFEESRSMGITGFPVLLLGIDGDLTVVTRGYAPYDRLEAPLVDFLRDRVGAERLGAVCSIDGVC